MMRRPAAPAPVPITGAPGPRPARSGTARWSRRRGVLGVFAAFAAVGFVAAYAGPTGMALAQGAPAGATDSLYATAVDSAQSLPVTTMLAEPAVLVRDSYTVYLKPKPAAAAPSIGQSVARLIYTGGGSPAEWMAAAGIAQSDWGYVDYIVGRESGWNPNSTNRTSGACGLVQALPCSKVPGNGYDPVDNLRWASGYAAGRYGGWAGAYAFWVSHNWW